MDYICSNCFDFIKPERWALGYRLCLGCGELYAKGQPLPKPVKIPPTQEEIARAKEIRQIEMEVKRRFAKKNAEKIAADVKKKKLKEMERLKKKYGEK
jgi:hypothetical protein